MKTILMQHEITHTLEDRSGVKGLKLIRRAHWLCLVRTAASGADTNPMAMLEAMMGVVGIRGLARLLGRDVKAVHTDTVALVNAGVLDRDEAGAVSFPYDEIRLRFTSARAA